MVDEIAWALDNGEGRASVAARVEPRRRERVQFVVDFLRAATDTMLARSDPVEGTLNKLQPSFQTQVAKFYRDVPVPRP
ncbi:MAG TPA: hypothetical protein VGO70_04550 [Arsenicitalea sp.]|nr:hypothetical protein [Arsenicitalea sp.]